MAIPENSSTITVEVTSADGQVVRKYILTVNRGGGVPPTDYSVTDHFGTWTGSGITSTTARNNAPTTPPWAS